MPSLPIGQKTGTTTQTTSAAGEITITHGLSALPTGAVVGARGDNSHLAKVVSISATALTVRVANCSTNADIGTTAVTVDWLAWVQGAVT